MSFYKVNGSLVILPPKDLADDLAAVVFETTSGGAKRCEAASEATRIGFRELEVVIGREVHFHGEPDTEMYEYGEEKIEKDSLYYLDAITFEAEGTLFNIPRHQFAAYAPSFLYTDPKNMVFALGKAWEDGPIALEGVTADEFRAVLRMLYPLEFPAVRNLSDWILVLKLSTEWAAYELREEAIKAICDCFSPCSASFASRGQSPVNDFQPHKKPSPKESLSHFDKIDFGRRFFVYKWFFDGLLEMVQNLCSPLAHPDQTSCPFPSSSTGTTTPTTACFSSTHYFESLSHHAEIDKICLETLIQLWAASEEVYKIPERPPPASFVRIKEVLLQATRASETTSMVVEAFGLTRPPSVSNSNDRGGGSGATQNGEPNPSNSVVTRILVAQKLNHIPWLVDAYADLVNRPSSLDLSEANKLGLDVATKLACVRIRVRRAAFRTKKDHNRVWSERNSAGLGGPDEPELMVQAVRETFRRELDTIKAKEYEFQSRRAQAWHRATQATPSSTPTPFLSPTTFPIPAPLPTSASTLVGSPPTNLTARKPNYQFGVTTPIGEFGKAYKSISPSFQSIIDTNPAAGFARYSTSGFLTSDPAWPLAT